MSFHCLDCFFSQNISVTKNSMKFVPSIMKSHTTKFIFARYFYYIFSSDQSTRMKFLVHFTIKLRRTSNTELPNLIKLISFFLWMFNRKDLSKILYGYSLPSVMFVIFLTLRTRFLLRCTSDENFKLIPFLNIEIFGVFITKSFLVY